MNITLRINGENKTFSQFFIPAKHLRKAMEMRAKINLNDIKDEDLDMAVNFTVEVFEKQFTADDVWNGVDYSELFGTIFNNVFLKILRGEKAEGDSEEKKN